VPLISAWRNVEIGSLVCFASSDNAFNCCAFSCFSSAAVSEIVSAIMVYTMPSSGNALAMNGKMLVNHGAVISAELNIVGL